MLISVPRGARTLLRPRTRGIAVVRHISLGKRVPENGFSEIRRPPVAVGGFFRRRNADARRGGVRPPQGDRHPPGSGGLALPIAIDVEVELAVVEIRCDPEDVAVPIRVCPSPWK